MRITILIVFVFGISAVQAQKQAAENRSSFDRSAKPLFKVKEGQEYEFGYLNVPENRSNPNSNLISLPVYIFKSRSENPKKDPIIYLVGGPGSSIMNAVPFMNYYRYLDDRDFILFEQRGTEYAKPNLDCPELAEAFKESQIAVLTGLNPGKIIEEAALKCRNKLIKKGIDLNGYNSLETAADIFDLKSALNIEEYNILSISYGTKIAQILMRDYPEGLRSVVMDSPLPLEVNYDLSSAKNIKMVYDKVFQDCRTDSICNLNYPNLENRFYEFINQCNEKPLELLIEKPETKKMQKVSISGSDLYYLISDINTSQIPKVPAMINEVINGNNKNIKSQIESIYQNNPAGNGLGMRLSVWCSEEMSFIDEEDEKLASREFPFLNGESTVLYSRDICKIWDLKNAEPKENEAIRSNIPTLLINGEYDTFTPISWAKDMLPNLENSYQVIFKGWQHGPTTYWSNPCGMQIANLFFNDPSQKPKPECFEQINKPVFTFDQIKK